MSVLECLQMLGSPRLERLLAEAVQDDRPFLRQFAERMQNLK